MLSILKSPALVLFFLSPFIAEFLTGATPPFGLLNPFLVLFFGFFYGSSAILIRELTLRWKKGIFTQLVLGFAFAILEEGIVTKVFFNPNRGDLSPLVNYGSYFGIHWGFVLFLMLFHSVFSINIPILLVSLMFPEKRSKPWVGSLKKFCYFDYSYISRFTYTGFFLFPKSLELFVIYHIHDFSLYFCKKTTPEFILV